MSKKKNKKNNKPKSKNTYSTQINNTNKSLIRDNYRTFNRANIYDK